MGPTEKSLKSIIDLMHETGANPKAGKPIPLESIYSANVISYQQYRQILDENEAERRSYRNARVADEMSAETDMLRDRMSRAGVPARFVDAPVDKTLNDAFSRGEWAYVHGNDVGSVTFKAAGLAKGWLADNRFGTLTFERTTTALTLFVGKDAQETMGRLSTAGMLLLSGLGSESAGSWAVSKLKELIETRFGNRVPMILTTRHTPESLAFHLGDKGGTDSAREMVELLRKQCVIVEV